MRGLWWDAQDNSDTLEETLKAACRARLTETQNGRFLQGTSANGAAVSFNIPEGNYNPESVASACGDLYDRYEEALEELIADGDATPADSEIFTRMMRLLVPDNERSADYSGMCDR